MPCACTYVESWVNCGGYWSSLSSNNTTFQWWSYGYHNTSLDIRKVADPWSRTGCFYLGGTLPEIESGPVPASSTYTISSVDYNSLYVARLLWVDSEGTQFSIRGGDCYFTIQPSEWL